MIVGAQESNPYYEYDVKQIIKEYSNSNMNDIGTYSTMILNNSKFNIYGQLRKVFTSNLLFYVSTFRKLAKHMTIKHKWSIYLHIYHMLQHK